MYIQMAFSSNELHTAFHGGLLIDSKYEYIMGGGGYVL